MSAIDKRDIMERHECDYGDEGKTFPIDEQAEHKAYLQKSMSAGLSCKFWFFAALNTLSTVGIVSTREVHRLCEPTDHFSGLCQ
jgi:hypothetical protein